jgi:PAS domain S-box-containing protein
MEDSWLLEGVALSMQLGTAVYSLRLNRLFGTDRAGWALFGAFALMLAMHVNQVWEVDSVSLFHGLNPQFVHVVISLLLLIGLTHVETLFRQRLRTEEISKHYNEHLEERIQERTHELADSNTKLQAEIHERHRAEQEIRLSQQRYQTLVNWLDCVVFEADARDLRFTFVSPQCERLLGFSPEHWLAQITWRELIHPDDFETIHAAVQQAASSSANCTLEFRALGRDQREVWMRLLTTVSPDGEGGAKIRGVLLDVTQQRAMEGQLRQAEKLECIARLAGGIAHEFNNVLTIIQGHSGLLLAQPEATPQVGQSAVEIQGASDRAAQLTRQLLAFAHLQPIQQRVLDLNELTSKSAEMLRRILGDDVRLTCTCAPAPALIKADVVMLEHVLMNLALNARQAMPNGGQLTLETSVVRLSDSYVAEGLRFEAGPYVRLTMHDTGFGIEPGVLRRIFEPFFTTKGTGKGTGLGLAMAYGIIRQHGGWIQASSVIGKGTAFEMYFPASSEPVSVERAVSPTEAPSGNETILVVEDESAVRQLVCTLLVKQGYRVIQADSGAAALEMWTGHQSEVDLLLTDIMMPGGMDGWELARRLKADKPALKVVYTSGYNPEMAGRKVLQVHFVAKPYQMAKLAQAVRCALDEPDPEPRPTMMA